MELATNLALIHRTLVKDSRVNSGLDVYNFGTFCDVSEEEMEKMNPFF